MTARLHHDFVAGEAPRAWLLMTHGIYGSGANWRSIARQVVARRPEWGAALVDLRLHGRSEPGDPPHTVGACADDLAALCDQLAAGGRPITVALGHSFGGKVVLALRTRRALAQTWVLDASPSARPGGWDAPDNSVRLVWEALRRHDRGWARRDDFVAALVADGLAAPLAHWLAMNLVPADGGGLRLRLDLEAVHELLHDYYALDLWPAVEDPALPGALHVVVATRASALSTDDRARLAAPPPAARLHVHSIDAGHWLHLDAPAAVVDLLATGLPAA
ncbi:MAG TPA: alpha/beta hydrolase [Kofleriaceae bacterium]|nr:alpha/beta hydrolase [Kofleriaceae bacterium]